MIAAPQSAPAPRPPGANTSLLLLIAAASGAGKTTLVHQLLAARPGLTRVVTCTTRPPRPGERQDVDYHFFSDAEFQRHLDAGEFLETATVYGFRYGTLRAEVLGKLRAGQDVLLNVDVQGSASIRAAARHDAELGAALVTIFLTTPSVAELEQRLRRRGTDAEEVIARRLAEARQEIAHWPHFDYLIVSGAVADDLRRALVIIEAEKLRTARAPAPPV